MTQPLKTIKITEDQLATCYVKAERAELLTRDETQALMSWCNKQTEALWDDMSLQEVLNVYRVSADWVTWEDWADWVTWEDWAAEETVAAWDAWDSAVIDPGNRMSRSGVEHRVPK